MVYWQLQTGELDAATKQPFQPLKVNLIVYDNDVMQVTGTSFYLWVLENFQSMASQVKTLISEVSSGEIFLSPSSLSLSCKSYQLFPQHKPPDDGVEPEVGCCLKKPAQAGVSFARIVRKLESLNRELNTLTTALAELTEEQQRHNVHSILKKRESQERINFMNDRILEIRELTGPRGLSAAHLARIKKIKSGSVFEDKTTKDTEGKFNIYNNCSCRI